MSVGLPLIGHQRSDQNHASIVNNDTASDSNCYHTIQLGTDFEVRLHTSDNVKLETGGSIWHAGYALSKYLTENPNLVYGKRVIEIGSGCGLAGITAALLGAKSVLLTDIESQQALLQENIALNLPEVQRRHGLSSQRAVMSAGVLYFGDTKPVIGSSCDASDDEKHLFEQFDVVLGADIGYDHSYHAPIANTVKSLLTSSGPSQEYVSTETQDTSSAQTSMTENPRNVPRIALLAEEIRWQDIYNWYAEDLRSILSDAPSVVDEYIGSVGYRPYFDKNDLEDEGDDEDEEEGETGGDKSPSDVRIKELSEVVFRVREEVLMEGGCVHSDNDNHSGSGSGCGTSNNSEFVDESHNIGGDQERQINVMKDLPPEAPARAEVTRMTSKNPIKLLIVDCHAPTNYK